MISIIVLYISIASAQMNCAVIYQQMETLSPEGVEIIKYKCDTFVLIDVSLCRAESAQMVGKQRPKELIDLTNTQG